MRGVVTPYTGLGTEINLLSVSGQPSLLRRARRVGAWVERYHDLTIALLFASGEVFAEAVRPLAPKRAPHTSGKLCVCP